MKYFGMKNGEWVEVTQAQHENLKAAGKQTRAEAPQKLKIGSSMASSSSFAEPAPSSDEIASSSSRQSLKGMGRDIASNGIEGNIDLLRDGFVREVFDRGLTNKRRQLERWHDLFIEQNGRVPAAQDFEDYFARKISENEGSALKHLKLKHIPEVGIRTLLPYTSENFDKEASLGSQGLAALLDGTSLFFSPVRGVRGGLEAAKFKKFPGSIRNAKSMKHAFAQGAAEGAADNLAYTGLSSLTEHNPDAAEYGIGALIGAGVGGAHKSMADFRKLKDYRANVEQGQKTSATAKDNTERAYNNTGLKGANTIREKFYDTFNYELDNPEHGLLATLADIDSRLGKEAADLAVSNSS